MVEMNLRPLLEMNLRSLLLPPLLKLLLSRLLPKRKKKRKKMRRKRKNPRSHLIALQRILPKKERDQILKIRVTQMMTISSRPRMEKKSPMMLLSFPRT